MKLIPSLNLKTLLIFLVVIFLAGCGKLFGYGQVIEHDTDIIIDESLEIPPDVINTTQEQELNLDWYLIPPAPKVYLIGPSQLECYVVTPEGNEECEGFWSGN